MKDTRLWAVRAGVAGEADSIFLDLRQIVISSIDVAADAARPITPGAARIAPVSQLHRFVHDMHIGDRVIYARRADRSIRWGEVTGPYVYDPECDNEFAHRRGVRWIARLGREAFSQGALHELATSRSLVEIKSFADEFWQKFEPPPEPSDATVTMTKSQSDAGVLQDILDTTRNFIAKRIKAELKGFPFEPFVADLFRAMGYRAHATRSVRDNGIDVIAHRDELGIEPPILKVQVKVNDANIGADCVKAFYAMVHERDVGIFMTTGGYSASAVDFARTKGNLKLVNGRELVDLIQKYYDLLDINYRRQIPLRRVLVPDVIAHE
jgi:restriction system protein